MTFRQHDAHTAFHTKFDDTMKEAISVSDASTTVIAVGDEDAHRSLLHIVTNAPQPAESGVFQHR